MTLSVAIAAFNGVRHFGEQLRSISMQSRVPGELVVIDDASTDETLTLVKRFAQESTFPVRILRNDSNKGSTLAFARAIGACSGEVIVLADQDDVWKPHKLETLLSALDDDPDAAFAFSDAEVVDENLKPMGHRLWEAIRFGESEQRRFRSRAFDCLLRRHRVTGSTMAFRSAFRDRILPIPDGWVHDAWIALVLSATSRCLPIPTPLIEYRQHANQQHGGRRRGWIDELRAARTLTADACHAVADRFEELRVRLEQLDDVPFDRLNLLREKIEHHRRRATMRERGRWRLPRVMREALGGGYSRFDQGWKTIAQDLLLN